MKRIVITSLLILVAFAAFATITVEVQDGGRKNNFGNVNEQYLSQGNGNCKYILICGGQGNMKCKFEVLDPNSAPAGCEKMIIRNPVATGETNAFNKIYSNLDTYRASGTITAGTVVMSDIGVLVNAATATYEDAVVIWNVTNVGTATEKLTYTVYGYTEAHNLGLV